MLIKGSSWPLLECWKVKRPPPLRHITPSPFAALFRYLHCCVDYEIVITVWCQDSSRSLRPHSSSFGASFELGGDLCQGSEVGRHTKWRISFQWCCRGTPSAGCSHFTRSNCVTWTRRRTWIIFSLFSSVLPRNNWITILKRTEDNGPSLGPARYGEV